MCGAGHASAAACRADGQPAHPAPRQPGHSQTLFRETELVKAARNDMVHCRKQPSNTVGVASIA